MYTIVDRVSLFPCASSSCSVELGNLLSTGGLPDGRALFSHKQRTRGEVATPPPPRCHVSDGSYACAHVSIYYVLFLSLLFFVFVEEAPLCSAQRPGCSHTVISCLLTRGHLISFSPFSRSVAMPFLPRWVLWGGRSSCTATCFFGFSGTSRLCTGCSVRRLCLLFSLVAARFRCFHSLFVFRFRAEPCRLAERR